MGYFLILWLMLYLPFTLAQSQQVKGNIEIRIEQTKYKVKLDTNTRIGQNQRRYKERIQIIQGQDRIKEDTRIEYRLYKDRIQIIQGQYIEDTRTVYRRYKDRIQKIQGQNIEDTWIEYRRYKDRIQKIQGQNIDVTRI